MAKKKKSTSVIPQVSAENKLGEGQFPVDFIERSIEIPISEDHPSFIFQGNSSYSEIPSAEVWDDQWIQDIRNIGELLREALLQIPPQSDKQFIGKKIVILDIETTDFIPKAYEGFVNILGLAILDFRNFPVEKPRIILHQSFNITRKKELAPHLIHLGWKYLENADIIGVFNAKFDITILKTIMQNFNLPYMLPETIIDFMKQYRNLATLEEDLCSLTGFKRTTTQKGSYSDYYKLFKGKGAAGINKRIEPIGSYNLMDVLTPLFIYILKS